MIQIHIQLETKKEQSDIGKIVNMTQDTTSITCSEKTRPGAV